MAAAETMGEITRLLDEWRAGSREAEAQLFERLYPELRRIAHSLVKADGRDPTLQPTALVHELYMRLVTVKDRNFENRRAFYKYAAVAMRRLLIDYWRRPRVALVPLGDLANRILSKEEKIALSVAVHGILDDLAKDHPEWCTVVELKFYLGLDNPSVAEVVGRSLKTVERIWHDARWWLFEKLGPEPWRSAAEP
jgi:RNA polymerase sigma factor (TIGR02999 family)